MAAPQRPGFTIRRHQGPEHLVPPVPAEGPGGQEASWGSRLELPAEDLRGKCAQPLRGRCPGTDTGAHGRARPGSLRPTCHMDQVQPLQGWGCGLSTRTPAGFPGRLTAGDAGLETLRAALGAETRVSTHVLHGARPPSHLAAAAAGDGHPHPQMGPGGATPGGQPAPGLPQPLAAAVQKGLAPVGPDLREINHSSCRGLAPRGRRVASPKFKPQKPAVIPPTSSTRRRSISGHFHELPKARAPADRNECTLGL